MTAMKRSIFQLTSLVFLGALMGCVQEHPATSQETLVLLHGMGRTRASMWVLEKRLQKAGYATLNFPYTAATEPLNDISKRLHTFLNEQVKTERYHLIGHSLGNIIVRNAFKETYRPGLGRIVMLAPPNQPADLAKYFKDLDVYRWIMGDSGQKLSSEVFYQTLPVPNVEFGVIAGDRGTHVVFKEPNDGIISVESTRLSGMKDFIVLHHTHTFMMNSGDTGEYCVRFLQTGQFNPQ
jgi:triacylglycerol lipase